MLDPKVSIVIPAYNASNYLAEAIESALAQTYKNVEIIVVNDGSKDNGATAAVAHRYADRIRYFEKENGGSSSALNTGINNMTGDWFSWLSHDDLYEPEKLERQIAQLKSLNVDQEDLWKHIFFTGSESVDERGTSLHMYNKESSMKMQERLCNLPGNEYMIAEPTRYTFHGCGCLVHKKALEQVGKFDESLRLVNDADLWFKLFSQNYIVHYLPEPLVKGRIHSRQVSRSIGFSYHNPEQDWYWNRSFCWLKEHFPENAELFMLFSRNAYLKTRNKEGDAAYSVLTQLMPEKKCIFWAQKQVYVLKACVRNLAKQVYIKFVMQ